MGSGFCPWGDARAGGRRGNLHAWPLPPRPRLRPRLRLTSSWSDSWSRSWSWSRSRSWSHLCLALARERKVSVARNPSGSPLASPSRSPHDPTSSHPRSTRSPCPPVESLRSLCSRFRTSPRLLPRQSSSLGRSPRLLARSRTCCPHLRPSRDHAAGAACR
jgi:hypothetical protein